MDGDRMMKLLRIVDYLTIQDKPWKYSAESRSQPEGSL